MPATGDHVFYTSSDGKEHLVHVLEDEGGTKLTLQTADGSTVSGIPHREPADYDAKGGGQTWRNA